MDRVFLWIMLLVNAGQCQFDSFSNLRDFRLTTDNNYPSRGDNVTLHCRRTKSYLERTSQNALDQDNEISWEENSQALFSTSIGSKGRCRVTRESSFLSGSSFRSNSDIERFTRISCRDDGTTVSVILRGWSPAQLSGDRWRCVQFPFAESNGLNIHSFVPIEAVTISQTIDKGDYYTPPRGTMATCVSSPCRPTAFIEWFVQTTEGEEIGLTSHGHIQESVDTSQDGLSVTVSSLLFSEDVDHGLVIYCKASNRERAFQAVSDKLTLTVQYPPTVSLQVKPDASLLEGSDVTLDCFAVGRPVPEVKWVRKGSDSSDETVEEDTVISLSPTVRLQSVAIADSGQYDCLATNGLEPDAEGSLVLLVRERPPSPAPTTAINRSPSLLSPQASSPPASASTMDGGVIAAIIIAVIVCLVIAGIVLFIVLRRRWSRQDLMAHLDCHGARIPNSIRCSQDVDSFKRSLCHITLRSDRDNRALSHPGMMDSEGQGVYAMCSTIPRMCDLPPYMDLLPPSYPERKLANVANPGYGMDDVVIGANYPNPKNSNNRSSRPLPNTPFELDSGYEEIDDVTSASILANHNNGGASSQPIIHQDNDGYEVPVTPAKSSASGDDLVALAMSRAPTEKSASRDRPFLHEFPVGKGNGNDSAGDDDRASRRQQISHRTEGTSDLRESEQNTPL